MDEPEARAENRGGEEGKQAAISMDGCGAVPHTVTPALRTCEIRRSQAKASLKRDQVLSQTGGGGVMHDFQTVPTTNVWRLPRHHFEKHMVDEREAGCADGQLDRLETRGTDKQGAI